MAVIGVESIKIRLNSLFVYTFSIVPGSPSSHEKLFGLLELISSDILFKEGEEAEINQVLDDLLKKLEELKEAKSFFSEDKAAYAEKMKELIRIIKY